MADLSNNPFVDHTSQVAARYPDLNGSGSPPQQSAYTNWVAQPGQQISYNATSPPPQYLQQQQHQFQQQPVYQQQQTGYQAQGQTGYFPPQQQQPPQQFQQPQVTGYSAYGQPQQQQAQFTGYPQQQPLGYQQHQPTGFGAYPGQQQPTSYGGNVALSQFDPYANVGQAFSPQQPGAPSFPNASTPITTPGGVAPAGEQHPRQYVQSHKSELETWDPVSWRQALNAFSSLQSAWTARKNAIDARIKALGPVQGNGFFGGQQQYGYGGYGGYNPQAQETERLNGLLKEAECNVDTVAAASFQMSEVQNSYRHSSDAASKRRVREATNAALQGLPEWPPQTF